MRNFRDMGNIADTDSSEAERLNMKLPLLDHHKMKTLKINNYFVSITFCDMLILRKTICFVF